MNDRRIAWRWIACALALGAAGSALAQKVYRCGPEGRTYQQSPCNDGKAVDAGDPRSAEQRRAAQDVASSEAKAAAKFDRDNQPASAPKGSNKPVRPAPAASSANAVSKKKAAGADKPLIYLSPAQPAASTAKP
ncbi:MAG: hypothetical protein IPG91_20220 [Ideonella sp.]|nr:hypothetical protein [Ideonella sp.]